MILDRSFYDKFKKFRIPEAVFFRNHSTRQENIELDNTLPSLWIIASQEPVSRFKVVDFTTTHCPIFQKFCTKS